MRWPSAVRTRCYPRSVNLTIELDREVDGRWIADIPELNILLYGTSKEDAIQRAEDAAREIIADRIRRGSLSPETAKPVFAVSV
jgi:predicted RNase H-like HicB family nuclease